MVQRRLSKVFRDLRQYWRMGAVIALELVLLGLFEYCFAAQYWIAFVAVIGNAFIVLSALWLSRAPSRFARVTVIDPDGREIEAEVAQEADDETILLGLVKKINLPSIGKNGKPIKYCIDTSDARKIYGGATIRIDKL